MPKPYDAATKFLVEMEPEAWPVYVGLPPAPADIISADLSTVTSDADKVIRVNAVPPYLLHVEFHAGPNEDLAYRTLHSNVLLGYRHKIPVQSVIIALRKFSRQAGLSGRFEYGWSDNPPYLQFSYRVVRVWEQSVEQALRGGLSTLPLAPLANVAQADLPDVIRLMDARIREEATPLQARELWTSAFVLMGLEYTPALSGQLLKGVIGMEESSTYQYILARGEALGIARGEALGIARGEALGIARGEALGIVEGKAQEARALILLLGKERFGDPAPDTQRAIESITSPERLEQLAPRLFKVQSWEEFLA